MVTVKKYGNRRLYDTTQSRYVTIEELAETVRAGEEIRVVDAKTGDDLTQATLAQMILESRGASKLLPVPFLVQLVRMGDDALAEFFGRWLVAALEGYLQAKQGVAAGPFGSILQLPFAASSAWTRLLAPSEPRRDEVAELRRELDELKSSLRKKKPGRKRR